MTNQYTTPMPVRIRGEVYPSAVAAAKALGVCKSTVYSALSRGNIDTVGLGRGRSKVVHKGGNPKAITIAGVTFSSMAEASLALGFTKKYLRDSLRQPGRDRQRIVAAVMRFADRSKA